MPKVKEFSPAHAQRTMYGEDDWEEQMTRRFVEFKGQMRIFAMGILSDLQEVASVIRPGHPTSNILGELETIRQYANKAKYVMSHYMMTSLSQHEEDTIYCMIDVTENNATKETLRWILDPRR